MISFVDTKKVPKDEKVLSLLRPYVREWFKKNFKSFTLHQKFAIPLIHKWKNVLITAPTGSGKTLSAFLAILNELFSLAEKNKLENKIYCIYISPLRALDNDIHRNLEVPLKEIPEIAKKKFGIDLKEVRVGIRTGDTLPSEKQKQLRKPPHILITTPETLAILLGTRKFKENLRDVRWIIVDEIHELANSKRGVHLSLSLERLQNFVGKEFVRIGLGACLKYDQIVWTDKGPFKIGELVEHHLKLSNSRIRLEDGSIGAMLKEKIFTFSFEGGKVEKKRVLKVWKIPAPKILAKVRTNGGREIYLTLNDRLLVFDGEKLEWKFVYELKKGEKIVVAHPYDTRRKISFLDLVEGYLDKLKGLRIDARLKKYKTLFKKRCSKEKRSVRSLLRSLSINEKMLEKGLKSFDLISFIKLINFLGLDWKQEIIKYRICGRRNINSIKLPLEISPSFLYLLGLLLSDGHNSGNCIKFTNKNKRLVWKISKLMKKEFKLKGKIKKRKMSFGSFWEFTVKSVALCRILDIFGVKIGKKFSDIKLPHQLFLLPNKLLLHLVCGFVDGDGSIIYNEKEKKLRVYIHTTSYEMFKQLRYILQRQGIACSSEKREKKNGWNTLFIIRVFRNSDALLIASNTLKGKKFKNFKLGKRNGTFLLLDPVLKEAKKQWELSLKELSSLTNSYIPDIIARGYASLPTAFKIIRILKNRGLRISLKDFVWLEEIREVEYVEFKEKYVYDLTIEDAHNFTAEGIIVHNTLEPLEEVAKFLVGLRNEKFRNCYIIDARFVKPIDIKVLVPSKNLIFESAEQINQKMYSLLHKLISKHKTTLVFTNTRSGAERVHFHLKKMFPTEYLDGMTGVHHSSISRDIRFEVEEKMKRGELKTCISSTSLELGIDIGYIDLVVQLGSPKSITRCIQRIGRAGHRLHEVSKGRIICMDRDDLVECSVMVQQAYRYFLDKIQIPQNCLDVLAQHIMGMSLEGKWNAKEAFKLIKSSYCYRNLEWKAFLSVLEFLSGVYHSLEEKKVYAKIWFDSKDLMFGRRGKYARVIYSLNIGTIPDEVKIKVRSLDGKYIGSIEEEFLQRLLPGDVFVLAGKTYEFVRARQATAYVKPVKEKRPTVPAWFSEMLPLSFELALKIQEFRGKMFELVKRKKKEEVVKWLLENYSMDSWSANSIYEYFLWEYRFLKSVGARKFPDQKTILVENYIDEKGNQNLIFHSLFGRRVNDALSRALGYLLTKKLKKSIGLTISDNGFIITVPSESLGNGWLDIKLLKSRLKKRVSERVEPKEVVKLIKSFELEEILKKALRRTELIKRRFRHCASRSLMILRNYKGYEIRVAKQQLNADRLLKVCEKIENFPIIQETYREILEDFMDVKHAKEVLEKIEKGEIEYEFLPENNVPSPFAFNLVVLGESDVVLMEDRKRLILELHKKVVERLGKDDRNF